MIARISIAFLAIIMMTKQPIALAKTKSALLTDYNDNFLRPKNNRVQLFLENEDGNEVTGELTSIKPGNENGEYIAFEAIILAKPNDPKEWNVPAGTECELHFPCLKLSVTADSSRKYKEQFSVSVDDGDVGCKKKFGGKSAVVMKHSKDQKENCLKIGLDVYDTVGMELGLKLRNAFRIGKTDITNLAAKKLPNKDSSIAIALEKKYADYGTAGMIGLSPVAGTKISETGSNVYKRGAAKVVVALNMKKDYAEYPGYTLYAGLYQATFMTMELFDDGASNAIAIYDPHNNGGVPEPDCVKASDKKTDSVCKIAASYMHEQLAKDLTGLLKGSLWPIVVAEDTNKWEMILV